MATIEFMPDRLNAEPVVFRGFTTPELGLTVLFSLAGGLVAAIPVVPFLGWIAFPTVALLMPLVTVIFGGRLMVRFKRGKPENYLYRRLEQKLSLMRYGNGGLILTSRLSAAGGCMSKFKHALNARDHHILSLRSACGMLLILLIIALSGWISSPRSLTIHNPPDLRSGSTRAWWEVPPATVYAFSFYIFQQLNSWPKNGDSDYPYRISSLSAYLTPSCAEFLLRDAKQRKDLGESRDRVRSVSEVPARGYRDESVSIIDRDNWRVRLDLVTDEYVNAERVKRSLVRYPLSVVRWDHNPEANPFGLALDCFFDTPQRLEAAPVVTDEKKGAFSE